MKSKLFKIFNIIVFSIVILLIIKLSPSVEYSGVHLNGKTLTDEVYPLYSIIINSTTWTFLWIIWFLISINKIKISKSFFIVLSFGIIIIFLYWINLFPYPILWDGKDEHGNDTFGCRANYSKALVISISLTSLWIITCCTIRYIYIRFINKNSKS
jgi:hypothetical protein